jgi:glucose-6-phosphate-specific signal transduction histidine kinase
VRNPGAGTVPTADDPGHGLVGMRERAAMVAGTLDARRTGDGAWVVRLSVPRAPGRDGREPSARERDVVEKEGAP